MINESVIMIQAKTKQKQGQRTLTFNCYTFKVFNFIFNRFLTA